MHLPVCGGRDGGGCGERGATPPRGRDAREGAHGDAHGAVSRLPEGGNTGMMSSSLKRQIQAAYLSCMPNRPLSTKIQWKKLSHKKRCLVYSRT